MKWKKEEFNINRIRRLMDDLSKKNHDFKNA